MHDKITTILTKSGQLITLSILFILTSLPIITMGASCAALYYAVVKSVRHNRSYPAREYFRAFKKNLLYGSIFLIFFVAFFTIMLYNVKSAVRYPLAAAAAGLAIWLFPVLSRFEKRFTELVMLSFVIAVRYFYYTLLMLAAGALVVLAFMYTRLLPLLCVFFLPGLWVYLSSYLIEKGMRPYMPKEAPEGVDAWYLE